MTLFTLGSQVDSAKYKCMITQSTLQGGLGHIYLLYCVNANVPWCVPNETSCKYDINVGCGGCFGDSMLTLEKNAF